MKSMQRVRKSSRKKLKKKKRGVEDIKNKQKKIILPLTKSSPSKKILITRITQTMANKIL